MNINCLTQLKNSHELIFAAIFLSAVQVAASCFFFIWCMLTHPPNECFFSNPRAQWSTGLQFSLE
jgi:hypothetical protein